MIKPKGSAKSKLTLSVDKDIINKAKNLGLNLSDVMEKVLRSFTFVPSKTDKESVYLGYKSIFKMMQPYLRDYGSHVTVAKWTATEDNGETFYENEIQLEPSGTLWNSDFEYELKDITDIPTWAFFEPTRIIFNFIEAMANGKIKREEELEKIELAKRLLTAIIESTDLPSMEKK